MLKFNNKLSTKRASLASRLFIVAVALFVLFNIFGAEFAFAQGVDNLQTSGLANNAGLDNLSGQVYLPETDIRVFIFRLINIALSFLGIILVGLIIYGGWLWMTSEGDPGKIEKAKAIFKNAAIGLVIILSSFGIVNFILKAFWGGEGGGGTSPGTTYDVGVGALGDGIIESHYPTRGQTDVPRNTMIIITFKEALKPETICGAVTCDGKQQLKIDNISIFSTANGGELTGDKNDSEDKAKITSAKVESNDNKTFVFRPDQFLGNQNQEQWYGVRLFGGKLKKSNGDAVKLGVADYYQWKFQVSTRLDLIPPQVQSIFPQPDNTPDTKIVAGNAQQAKWTMTVNSAPIEYKKSAVRTISPPAGVSLGGTYQSCQGSGQVEFKIGTGTDQAVGKLAIVLNSNPDNIKAFNGESIILNNKVDIGCGLSLNFTTTPTSGMAINIKVTAEQAGDKISIDGQDYVFGKEIKTQDRDGIADALKDNQLISTQVHATLQQVTLTAKPEKLPGAQGNNIEILVSNAGALVLTKTTVGKDKEEGYKIVGRPDQPRNAVIQINFNEAMNPIQLQGDSTAVKDYIQVLNGTTPIEGIFTISNIYKTVEFKTNVKCGENSCGDEIYCLPPLANIKVWVKAASLLTCTSNEECAKTSGNNLNFGACSGNATTPGICQQDSGGKKINYPQSLAMDGAMDAAANSLDGNSNGNAEGPVDDFYENSPDIKYNTNELFGDNYAWSFWTSDKIDLASPIIEKAVSTKSTSGELNLVDKGKQVVGANTKEPISVLFNKIMMSSSFKPGRNYPDDYYYNPDSKAPKIQREYFIFQNFSSVPLGYWLSKIDSDASTPADGFADKTTAVIDHTTLSDNGAYGFVIGSGAKDIYQNCYNPAGDKGEGSSECSSGMGVGNSCCKGIKNSSEDKCYKF